jgi:hypothetical protein
MGDRPRQLHVGLFLLESSNRSLRITGDEQIAERHFIEARGLPGLNTVKSIEQAAKQR